ncbi:uncharacterized protein LOC119671344 [Teleopsis dalmanni]|uniref:uncharacterized protein LOC119671344 n=1 Tax=Teleopsis dalmanni TaxID=139649 RepID=UPI0018CDC314|nr:uncharacterized protein LOC119671344 [Teleopsis dalmanni]
MESDKYMKDNNRSLYGPIDNSDIFVNNREEFSSQLNLRNEESFINSDYLERTPRIVNTNLPLSQLNDDSCSLFIDTQNLSETIVVDTPPPPIDKYVQPIQAKTTNKNVYNNELHFPKKATKEDLDLSSVAGTNYQRVDDSFTNEFEKFANEPFDIDLEELSALEKLHTTKNITTLSKTQIDTSKKLQNITSSCPIPKKTTFDSADVNRITEHNNPLDLLSLGYRNGTISSIHGPSNSIQNTIQQMSMDISVNEHTSIQHIPPIEHDNNLSIDLNSSIEVNNVQKLGSVASILLPNNSTVDATLSPQSIIQLHTIIKKEYSDFAFVYALSAQLCQDRIPMDCFVNLKMALLLSLASIGPIPNRIPIPIIAIGNDTSIINYLMTSIGQLGARFLGPTYKLKSPAFPSNQKWIEADPILLAQGGVYFAGDWSCIKAARADKIFKFIECSRVSIEKSSVAYPLETSIWAHWRAFKNNARDQQMFNKFIKIFGLPIYVDEDNHEVLVDYILQQSSINTYESTIDDLSISNEDMRHFLAIISKRTVDFTQEAERLLQEYFVASRIERPGCLTKQSFVTIKQFSESFAKLSFRHEVLSNDVVAAIYISEHFIFNAYGTGQHPPPHFKSCNFIGAVDEHLRNFKEWLETYINKYYNSS